MSVFGAKLEHMSAEDPLDAVRGRFSRNYPAAVYVGKGWVPLVTNLHAALVAADPELRYCIVAEKYGVLQVMLERDTEQTRKLIREAEERAMATCDQCGGAGSMHTRGGMATDVVRELRCTAGSRRWR